MGVNPATATAPTFGVLDHHQITDLVSRLGLYLDEGRFDELHALLTDDVTVQTPGGRAEGRQAVVGQARRNHRVDQPIQHLVTNLVIDGHHDRARVRANLVVHFAAPGVPEPATVPPVQLSLGEIYRFEVTRTPAGWRFTSIETTPVWRSDHVGGAADPARD